MANHVLAVPVTEIPGFKMSRGDGIGLFLIRKVDNKVSMDPISRRNQAFSPASTHHPRIADANNSDLKEKTFTTLINGRGGLTCNGSQVHLFHIIHTALQLPKHHSLQFLQLKTSIKVTMSSDQLNREASAGDVDIESDRGHDSEYTPTEQSPLLPNDPTPQPQIVPSKSFQRKVMGMCILMLFIVEVSQFIMEPPLQKIMEDIICRDYYPNHALRMPRIQDHQCKNTDVQKTLAMVRGWLMAVEMATRKSRDIHEYHAHMC